MEQQCGTAPKDNPAEGFGTLRNYNLLAKGSVFQKMPVHANVLPIVEHVLAADCLLSGMTAIHIGPKEDTPQPLHPDDIFLEVERPHAAFACTTMWALSDFTAANGATQIAPGSHKYDHGPDFSKQYESIAAEMPAGSVLIFNASLWHGGGANTTDDDWRLGVAVQYCRGWLRTQQNHYLGISQEVMRSFPDRLLELCGLKLYRGMLGHIDGESPGAALGLEQVTEAAYTSDQMEVPTETSDCADQ